MWPVAVFTDGFIWHKDRLGHDCAQRMALIRSRKYTVWSLVWDDVETALTRRELDFPDFVEAPWNPQIRAGFWQQLHLTGHDCWEPRADNFMLLVQFLHDADERFWTKLSDAYAQCAALGRNNTQYEAAAQTLQPVCLQEFALPPDTAFAQWTAFDDCELFAATRRIQNNIRTSLLLRLHDQSENHATAEFKQTWRGYLRAVNLYQFVEDFCAVTTSGCAEGMFDDLLMTPSPTCLVDIQPGDQAWQECRDLVVDERASALLDGLMRAGCALPEVGYELSADGHVLGEMELAWPECHVGVLTDAYASLRENDSAHGWKLFLLADSTVDILLNAIRE